MEETIKLLENGKILGYIEEIPEIISTGASYVFIFRKNKIALKLYRRDNEHWNTHFSDMSKGEARRNFIIMDYEWNHFYSPDVYLGIKQINITDNNMIELSEELIGDELVIEMKIIESSTILMNALNEDKKLSQEDFFLIGKQVAEFTKSNKIEPVSGKNFYEMMTERVVDIMSWMKNLDSVAGPFVSKVETYLTNYIENSRVKFENLTDKDFVTAIDCHAANASYEAGRLYLIDVLPPKDLWRIARVNENFGRIGTDIAVLYGKEFYDYYHNGFRSITQFNNEDELFDQIYNASIMMCVQVSYANKNKKHQVIADKYFNFINSKLDNI